MFDNTPIFSGNYSNSVNASLLNFNGNNNTWSSSNNNYSCRIISVMIEQNVHTSQQWKHSPNSYHIKAINQNHNFMYEVINYETYIKSCKGYL